MLTTVPQVIIDALQHSAVVEVQVGVIAGRWSTPGVSSCVGHGLGFRWTSCDGRGTGRNGCFPQLMWSLQLSLERPQQGPHLPWKGEEERRKSRGGLVR